MGLLVKLGYNEIMDIGYLLIVLVSILISMTLHEAVHGFVAYYLGDHTAKSLGRLTLNPIKHIDPFLTVILPVLLAISGLPIFGGAKPVPFNPNVLRHGVIGVALVAVAGPLTNLVLAFISFGIFTLVGGLSSGVGAALMIFCQINLGFFIFNMIPIPPLDGSRVLYAIAPDFIRQGMEAIERAGLVVIFGIVLIASSAIGSLISSAMRGILKLFMYIFGLA